MNVRQHSIDKMTDWMPNAASSYQSSRNYDLDGKQTTSRLSESISAGILREMDVIDCAKRFNISMKNNKFIEEVFWRVYFRGYFETHPSVWTHYTKNLNSHFQKLPKYYDIAVKGETEIECFNAWINQLKETGYLHNHTRMWFASIWIFTLDLPWELGADLFMRYLNDADEASNTLSWRWVAGLHTSKKPYVARASNIFKYTQKYNPQNKLNPSPEPIKEAIDHPFKPLELDQALPYSASLVMFDNFLDIKQLNLENCALENFYVYEHLQETSRNIDREKARVRTEIVAEISNKINLKPQFFNEKSIDCLFGQSLITNYIFSGYFKDQISPLLNQIERNSNTTYLLRNLDSLSWNFCKGGYFKLKTKIQEIIADLFEPQLFAS
jgi:deoxyribodipyrimidine photo-lyase